jgi:hypothetical protein
MTYFKVMNENRVWGPTKQMKYTGDSHLFQINDTVYVIIQNLRYDWMEEELLKGKR